MMCAWKEFLSVLPLWLRQEVDRIGRKDLQELRLRRQASPELVLGSGIHRMNQTIEASDISFCVNAASRYSPWAAATVARGFLTAPGGHRIGLCGTVVFKDGAVSGLREITSLNIRIARDFPGISRSLRICGSTLIIGAPGWGKTTLLRDIARELAAEETVAVVDERGELFPDGILRGNRMDVLTGCPKAEGIEMVLRSMGPSYIAVDEITAQTDTQALLQATGCGVGLLATAHAASLQDLKDRPVYRTILECGIFRTLLILRKDKSFYLERTVV